MNKRDKGTFKSRHWKPFVLYCRKGEKMIRVDEEFMAEVGLAEMPVAEKQEFMNYAEEELEVRVGQQIGARMTDAQLDEFERIFDVAEAAEWLEKNVPNYREIVENVFGAFKKELIAEQAKILGY